MKRDDAAAAEEVEALLGEWLAQSPREDVEEFLARHPAHADELREQLAMSALLDRSLARPPSRLETLGPFRIERELGSGGMGTVFRAVVAEPTRGIATGRTVALKVVHPHLFRTAGFFKRFLREAELGRRIDHPNVVRTLDADAVELGDRTQHYLVMEYVEGQTLRDLVDDIDRVPEELARHVGCEVAKALTAIHGAGAVHRDLKPENVLITPDHEVKVMDLGVARLADEQVRLSQTGAFVGSLHYAAPEQFGGGTEVDARADLHGLGLLLYEIATGENPYADEDARVAMRRILAEPPRKAGELNPQLSPFFEEVLARLLQKDPAARFQSADEVLGVLEQAEDSDWWHERAMALRSETHRPLRRIRVPRETAVYGRDAEIARLRALYDAAKSGDGRVVLVEGEAGIGKTRLVDEFVARLQQEGEDVHFVFASYPPGGAATASGAFSAAYREHLGEVGLDDALAALLPQTPILVPAFAALLRGDAPPKDAEPLTKDSLQTCFVHLTRNLAAERTTIVLIDDLHFAPEEGRALFTSLALAVPGHRVLLIGTMRPGVPEDWIAGVTRLEQTSQLSVPRLGPKDLFTLLGDSFRSQRLAEELGAKIAMKSDGNPFFAFEIIRGLREEQFITRREDGTWQSTRLIEDIQVPSSVLDLVNARVADLDEDERNLLDVASCWDYEFDPSLVAEALGFPRLAVLQRLGRIEKKHRLVRATGRRFVFDHHQVQEALYGALSEMLREEYHAALADALATRTNAAERDPETLDGDVCVQLCEHYLRGARGEMALRYLEPAHARLCNRYQHAQAVALGERALAVPGLLTGSERADALLRLAGAYGPLDLLARRARQQECAREAERLADEVDDDRLRWRAANALAAVLHRTSRFEEAEAAFLRVLCRARALEHEASEAGEVGEAGARMSLGSVFWAQGRLSEAQEQSEHALVIFREIAKGGSGEAMALVNLGLICWSRGRLSEAQSHCEQALDIFREIGDRVGEGKATVNLGLVFDSRGRFSEARDHYERSLALCREIGDRASAILALNNLGDVCMSTGRVLEARELFGQSLALSRETGSLLGEANATGNLGNVLLGQGRLSEAQEHYERHLAMSREIGDRRGEVTATNNLGHLCLLQSRLLEAQEQLERSLALSRDIGVREGEDLATRNLGHVFHSQGRLPDAKARFERCLALCREAHLKTGEAAARHYLGRVLRDAGELDASREHLLGSLAISEETGVRSLEATTRLELGSLRVAMGDLERGREALAAASGLAHEIGDVRVEVLARCELALLPGVDAGDAVAAYAEHEHQLLAGERRAVLLHLWKATGDRTHLEEAKRLLDAHLATNPPEYHESMLTNVRVNREILAAWREEFGEAGPGHDEPGGTESVTRIG